MPKRILLATMATIAVASGLVAAQPGAGTASTPLDAEEQLFVSLINQYRQQNGINALTIDTSLQNAAEWMTTDMGVNNYFSHTDSLGRDPFVRMNAFGYDYNTWKGENIAAGTSSAQVAFDLWKGSASHNANMLNPNYTVMGIARDDTPGSDYGWYWYAVARTIPRAQQRCGRRRLHARRGDAPRDEPERPLRQPESCNAGVTEPRLAGGPPRRQCEQGRHRGHRDFHCPGAAVGQVTRRCRVRPALGPRSGQRRLR
jgi:uncharacterized protein YkwD